MKKRGEFPFEHARRVTAKEVAAARLAIASSLQTIPYCLVECVSSVATSPADAERCDDNGRTAATVPPATRSGRGSIPRLP